MQCSAYFPKAHANCLIYLDDVIVFSHTEEEHLERMRVIFDRLREHGLKLKPSKCEVFKTEINYLAHHVSKKGVPAIKEEPGVHHPMSSAGYVHEGEIFRWPGRTLQAFH